MAGSSIRAVAFDCFGTLLRIGDRRDPYKRLLGASPKSPERAFDTALTRDLQLPDLVCELGVVDIDIAAISAEVDAELRSVVAYDEVAEILGWIRAQGLATVLISNLATPYGAVVDALLGRHLDALVLSYAVGLRKPDPRIYHYACQALGCRPEQVLMVGDSIRSDLEGARSARLHSVLLDRAGVHRRPDAIRDLRGLQSVLRGQREY